jgi:hypothetical protein
MLAKGVRWIDDVDSIDRAAVRDEEYLAFLYVYSTLGQK